MSDKYSGMNIKDVVINVIVYFNWVALTVEIIIPAITAVLGPFFDDLTIYLDPLVVVIVVIVARLCAVIIVLNGIWMLSEFWYQSFTRPDLTKKDTTGQTPLHHACSGGHLGDVRTLMSELLLTNQLIIKDYIGQTPLHCACSEGHLEIVRALVQEVVSNYNKDNLTVQDNAGRTPLHYACAGGHLDVFRVLAHEEKSGVLL